MTIPVFRMLKVWISPNPSRIGANEPARFLYTSWPALIYEATLSQIASISHFVYVDIETRQQTRLKSSRVYLGELL
jgi:hypothetical protein